MPIYKDKKNGTWYAMVRYKDWTGANKQKCQRGFETKREAQEWEYQFKLKRKADIDMTLASFCELYEMDVKPKLKLSTWLTKESIIKHKILPYLGKRKIAEITAKDVVDWQNKMRELETSCGKTMSPTYLKTIADRVGHECEKITYRYAHLFPSKQDEMVQRLNMERKEEK